MTCFRPIGAYRYYDMQAGKIKYTISQKFVFEGAHSFENVCFPCGKCVGCRVDHARQWSVRCVHEASLYPSNCFITLTFNDENLDSSRSLDKRYFVLFMKRLRKKFGSGIRFFHCAEYGEKFKRPHHHALLFNFDFPDKLPFPSLRVGSPFPLFRSPSLEELWPYGYSSVGSVTLQSAGYVARYALKKVNGLDSVDHYGGRLPEYITMSNRPGIGYGWIEKYLSDVYPSDSVVFSGSSVRFKPPPYYDKIFRLRNSEGFDMLKEERERSAILSLDNSPERLVVREQVLRSRLCKLKRSYENGT